MDAVTDEQVYTPSLDLDLLEAEVIREINDSLERRERNDRDNISQALRGCRNLARWRDAIAHGDWRAWVIDKTNYKKGRSDRSAIRRAQNDIQLWNRWKDRIDDLSRLGLIHDLDAPESDLVGAMTDTEVTMSKSALEEFMREGVPELALDMVIESLEKGSVQIKQAEQIIATAKRIEALPDDGSRQLATELNRQYGLTNPRVIDMMEQINEQPDLAQEMLNTGHVYVPGLNKQVPIAEAGETDIELTLGRHVIEEEIESQQHSRAISAERQDRTMNFNYSRQIEGTLQQVMFQLQQQHTDDTIYRVVVYSRKTDV